MWRYHQPGEAFYHGVNTVDDALNKQKYATDIHFFKVSHLSLIHI